MRSLKGGLVTLKDKRTTFCHSDVKIPVMCSAGSTGTGSEAGLSADTVSGHIL